ADERTRQRGAGGVDEPLCKTKRRVRCRYLSLSASGREIGDELKCVGVTSEIVSIVRMVKQVECLEHELHFRPFTQLDVLRQANIHVVIRIAAQRVVRNDVAVAGVVAGRFRYVDSGGSDTRTRGIDDGRQLRRGEQIVRSGVGYDLRSTRAATAKVQHVVPR